MTACSSKGCHCRTDPARRHGPYWQLELYQGWIAERHRAEAILDELEELSVQAAVAILSRAAGEPPDSVE